MKNKNKAIRKLERHLKNLDKQQRVQNFSGKLIEENHNGYDYTYGYTCKAVSWHLGNLWMKTRKYKDNHDKFCRFFGKVMKEKLQTLLLHWNTTREKDWSYYFIMNLLDIYREYKMNSGDILWEECNKLFKNQGL